MALKIISPIIILLDFTDNYNKDQTFLPQILDSHIHFYWGCLIGKEEIANVIRGVGREIWGVSWTRESIGHCGISI